MYRILVSLHSRTIQPVILIKQDETEYFSSIPPTQSIDRGYLAQLSDPIADFVYDYGGASETNVICTTL